MKKKYQIYFTEKFFLRKKSVEFSFKKKIEKKFSIKKTRKFFTNNFMSEIKGKHFCTNFHEKNI